MDSVITSYSIHYTKLYEVNMPGVDEGIFFPVKKLREWSEQVFRKAGVPHDDSILLADSLITANLRGVDTHGITRMLPVSYNFV